MVGGVHSSCNYYNFIRTVIYCISFYVRSYAFLVCSVRLCSVVMLATPIKNCFCQDYSFATRLSVRSPDLARVTES